MFDNIAEVKEYFDTISIDKSPKTIRVYSDAVNKMFSYLHIESFQDVKKITVKNLRDHQNNMLQSGMQPSSVNTNTRPIRAMFNWLVENEYLNKSPMDKMKDLKAKRKDPAVITEDEITLMVKACKNELDRILLVMYLTTGLRREELISLKLSDYNGTHINPLRKGNEKQEIILQPGVKNLLDKYLEKRIVKYPNTDALFVSKMGKRFTGTAIYYKIKSIAKLAGLPEDRIKLIHVHSTRHSFAGKMLDEGNDIHTLQRILNHRSIATTMLYAHLSTKKMDSAILNQKEIV